MVAEVFERERGRMQLGPQLRASQWAAARDGAPASSAQLPAIAFRTPGSQPTGVPHGATLAGEAQSAATPASGALSGLARRHALPGVLRFGGGARPLYEWRLLMKVRGCTDAMVLARALANHGARLGQGKCASSSCDVMCLCSACHAEAIVRSTVAHSWLRHTLLLHDRRWRRGSCTGGTAASCCSGN